MIENSTIVFNTTNKDMQREVLRIDGEGRIYWLGREVESDADLRKAMLGLCEAIRGMKVEYTETH
ncbi:MAG: hypothetical protein QX189_04360 [Methylococcales bacterium]